MSGVPANGVFMFTGILMRDVTSRSLAAVDELGRGTAPKEGAAIVGAVLEELDRRGCLSLFATHLHDELHRLPLTLHATTNKVLRVVAKNEADEAAEAADTADTADTAEASIEGGPVQYVYRVEDGVCTNSHSLATAAYHGVGQDLIARASELQKLQRLQELQKLQELQGKGTGTKVWRPEVGAEVVDWKKENTAQEEQHHQQDEAQDEAQDDAPADKLPRPFSAPPLNLTSVIQTVHVLQACPAPVTIEPGWDPPPVLADQVPCVYLLEVVEKDGGGRGYYIGETKHLADRMKRHRQHFGANISFCVFPMEGRTKARTTEARAIVEARRAGFTLYNLAS